MKGVVFTELLAMAEQRYGIEVLDTVLLAAGLDHGGAYTAVGSYDWREFQTICDALAEQVGLTAPELLRSYGQHLFGVFAARYPAFFADTASPFDFLENVEALIHPEVRKLYPDADLPRFEVERTTTGLRMRYVSKRPFAELARGLLEGCMQHFGVAAEIGVSGDERNCTFEVTVREEAGCPAATI
ncbi:MAG: heme NO-binding domain-containing protein [bacterium]|nr:heme NO-binding domain-containing protein [bacterium]